MWKKPGVTRLTATGDIASAAPIRIYSISCKSGGTAGNWTFKDNGSSGTELLYVAGSANDSVNLNFEGGVLFANGAHLTEDNATNCEYATIVYEKPEN